MTLNMNNWRAIFSKIKDLNTQANLRKKYLSGNHKK